jgi:hypothetical protein
MAFPSTYLAVRVEVALGADLTASPSTWAWTDATALGLIRASSPITIRRGGYDGAIQAPPSTCTFTADNTDGRWVPSNPSGAWYGQLVKGTPVRVLVDEGTESVRWTGFLTSLPPRWNLKETDRYVEVTASGIMQRLQRGSTPLRSPLVRAMTGTSTPPVAYWSGEDGSQSTAIAEFYGGKPMQIVGQVLTLADDGPSGSLPLPEFTTVAGVRGVVPNPQITGEWSVACVFNFPAAPSAETSVMRWSTTGTLWWQMTIDPTASPDDWELLAYDSSGTLIVNANADFTLTATGEAAYGSWVMFVASATQNGANIDYQARVYDSAGSSVITGTATSQTAGMVSHISVNANSKVNGMHAGHWAVWDVDLDSGVSLEPNSDAVGGYDGELVSIRASRLGDEAGGVPINLDSLSTLEMGPQPIATILDIYRECEAVSNGRLFEEMDPTAADEYLHLKQIDDLADQDTVLTLNHDSGHLADLQPTDDDQNYRNDWTATRSGGAGTGSSGRIFGTEPLIPDSVSVNVYEDADLVHQAGWRYNVTSFQGLRYPSVQLNLARAPSLIPTWITCDIGSRITITNPPDGIEPDSVDLIIEGWTEVLGPKTWSVTLNCSPFQPYRVIEMAVADDPNAYAGRYAADPDCALRVAIDTNDTSMDVDPNRKRWTTSTDHLPMNISLKPAGTPGNGEVVTVSAVSTDAATFIAVGAASHADNAAVTPALYAGNTTDHMIFVVGAIRSSGTGTLSITAGYTRLPIFKSTDHIQVWAKVHDGSESDPTVTPAGGAAGDTVSAFTFGFGNIPITLDDLGDMVVDSITQLNSSAANIAYGGLYSWKVYGCVQLIVAWKQDDYTSVALPAGSGFTEMIEASSTTGNDQSLYCAYRIDTTPAVVNGDSLAVTGGASAISRAAVFAIAGGKQTFTLSARSVNGVTASHAVGTRVAVHNPGVVSL